LKNGSQILASFHDFHKRKQAMKYISLLSSKKGIHPFQIWMLAIRPKTLTATLIPVLVGTMLAYQAMGSIHWLFFLPTLLCALLVQIGINLTNDALDFYKGADSEKRIGFKRVSSMGLIAPKRVLMGGFFCFALALLGGLPAIFYVGWPPIAVLLSSITLGYLYTGGPFPLAYYGLGDLFTMAFFGVICTATAYYVQTQTIDVSVLIAGIQIGCLATAMIAINNLRDREVDAQAYKRTLAVLLGKRFARIEITLMLSIPFILGFYWVEKERMWAAYLPLLLLPTAYRILKSIWQEEPSVRYNVFFVHCALIHLLFGLLLIGGLSINEYRL
jgi:1,4-dihydroxy-2-naphthoate octaprenyltransferase